MIVARSPITFQTVTVVMMLQLWTRFFTSIMTVDGRVMYQQVEHLKLVVLLDAIVLQASLPMSDVSYIGTNFFLLIIILPYRALTHKILQESF